MRARSTRCPGCGAAKVAPYKSAYVYCDYCGRLMDWDFEVAKYSGQVAAGPHYRALREELEPRLAAALEARDAAALGSCHRALFDQYMRDCPTSYSPRLGDPAYREAVLTRSVHATVVCELNRRWRAARDDIARAVRRLEWVQDAAGATRATPATFWRLYEAELRAAEHANRLLPEATYPCPDPDETPPELSRRMRASITAQAWVAYLDEATFDELLDKTGLRADYQDVPDPVWVDAACAHCGAGRRVPEGARRGVCEACGHRASLSVTAPCSGCGASLEFGAGRDTASCPHCHAQARLVGRVR